MHVTWLVSDTNAFERNPGPTSKLDCIVPSLTYKEWFELFFVVLGVRSEDTASLENCGRDARIVEFDEEIAGYPMLSRICGVYWDAAFEPDEVQNLEDECERVLENASNALASKGVEKLLAACKEAKRLGLGIFMMCD